MWQNIIVIAIVAVVAGLTGWRIYQLLTGKSSGCGGCSAKGSSCCGSGAGGVSAPVRPLSGSGCGCGH